MKINFLMLVPLLFSWVSLAIAEQPLVVKSGDNRTAVVELYTSEGCSSCPPADRWLGHLVETPRAELDVLALAFHVDYWDYIGWKDEFADPRYTQRQRDLGDLNRQHTIYTPEFFVDGIEARGTGKIVEQILQANKTPADVALQLSIQSSAKNFRLKLRSESAENRKLRVEFVVFEDGLGNQVASGENAGNYLSHHRVVRYLSRPFVLSANIDHDIPIQRDWQQENLGIGALVKSQDGQYQQAVFTLLEKGSQD